MKHRKTFHSKKVETPRGIVVVEGPVEAQRLAEYVFHHDLTTFRTPDQQQKALVEIARRPEGRIIISRRKNTVVGYVTFVYPDPIERWSEGKMENLLELGAVEVVPDYRKSRLGKTMLMMAMKDEAMEDYIIFTTEYYWHWDLKGTGLSVWEYRKMMENMMKAGGLEWMATDDPEICSHPANCLMVRIGKRVDQEDIERFDRLRFHDRIMY